MRVHSYVSPKCSANISEHDRQGLFANQSISQGEIVSIWGGIVLTSAECELLSNYHSYFETHSVSVYWGIYYGSQTPDLRDDAELINHSCNANVGVVGQILLVAKRDIQVGEELTFDYDTTEAEATPFECNCGSPNCRGTIAGESWKDPSFLNAKAPFLSWYLTQSSNTTSSPVPCVEFKSQVALTPLPSTTRLHSWLSAKCTLRKSDCAQLGVFASDAISANELVAVWGGTIYTSNELKQLACAVPHMLQYSVQVADGFHIAGSSLTALDDAERFNHSCDPNVGVKGQILILARRDIEMGEELTFDYETTDTDMTHFLCNCGSPLCRGGIDGNAWKLPEYRQRNAGWFSWYLQQKIASNLK